MDRSPFASFGSVFQITGLLMARPPSDRLSLGPAIGSPCHVRAALSLRLAFRTVPWGPVRARSSAGLRPWTRSPCVVIAAQSWGNFFPGPASSRPAPVRVGAWCPLRTRPRARVAPALSGLPSPGDRLSVGSSRVMLGGLALRSSLSGCRLPLLAFHLRGSRGRSVVGATGPVRSPHLIVNYRTVIW